MTHPNYPSEGQPSSIVTPKNVWHQRRTRLARLAKATQAVEFFNVLTSPELFATTEALLPEHRVRLELWRNDALGGRCPTVPKVSRP